MNNIINEHLNNPNIVGIMNAVASRYAYSIDFDQIESIKLNTLWECIKKYDPTRGAKFTSFLYQQLTFALKNELKKTRREFPTEHLDQNADDSPCTEQKNELEILDGLPDDIANILSQKYIYNMTMVEIGQQNGYSRETARRKLARAVKIYKNKNQIEA